MVLIIGLLIPLLGTMLGAAFVFLMKDEMPLHGRSIGLVAADTIDGDG